MAQIWWSDCKLHECINPLLLLLLHTFWQTGLICDQRLLTSNPHLKKQTQTLPLAFMPWFTELAWTDGSAIFVRHTHTHTRYCYNWTFHCFLVATVGEPAFAPLGQQTRDGAGRLLSTPGNDKASVPKGGCGCWGARKTPPPEGSEESLTLRLKHRQKAGERHQKGNKPVDTAPNFLLSEFLYG